MTRILDGKLVAKHILTYIPRNESIQPLLHIICTSDDPASEVYVRQKRKVCEAEGIRVVIKDLSKLPKAEILESMLQSRIVADGIIVQLPVRKDLNARELIEYIRPSQDVDCLTYESMGKLQSGAKGVMPPCTPNGIMHMLKYYGIDVDGKRACILGRSEIVGKPIAAMLQNANATTICCNSHTLDVKGLTLASDIIVCAVGIPKFLTKDMVKQGAVVIDVGINRLNGKLCGDADYTELLGWAGAITPVPGGVGRTTTASLVQNMYQTVLPSLWRK